MLDTDGAVPAVPVAKVCVGAVNLLMDEMAVIGVCLTRAPAASKPSVLAMVPICGTKVADTLLTVEVIAEAAAVKVLEFTMGLAAAMPFTVEVIVLAELDKVLVVGALSRYKYTPSV